jgi:hypothetical protein
MIFNTLFKHFMNADEELALLKKMMHPGVSEAQTPEST